MLSDLRAGLDRYVSMSAAYMYMVRIIYYNFLRNNHWGRVRRVVLSTIPNKHPNASLIQI